MHEFLFEPCILRCLNSIWKKIPCDFMIRFYNPSLFCIFYAVSKMRFWQPWMYVWKEEREREREMRETSMLMIDDAYCQQEREVMPLQRKGKIGEKKRENKKMKNMVWWLLEIEKKNKRKKIIKDKQPCL